MTNTKNGLIAAGVAVLAVLAVAGWMRKPSSTDPVTVLNPATSVSASQPAYYDQNGQPVYGQQAAPGSASVVASSPGYQPAIYSSADPDNRYVSDQYVRSIHRPVRVVSRDSVSQQDATRQNFVHDDGRVYRDREVVTPREGRSKGKSVAIVAGSAAGGAAIGAIAGGGKGAGIGALAGGGAGFIYDRLTHNHR